MYILICWLYSGLKGGALASAVHAHLKDGDPFNQSLVGQVLRHVARPLRYLIDQWVYEGELNDIYDEVRIFVGHLY